MNKKTTFSATIKNYWSTRGKDSTKRTNIKNTLIFTLIALLVACGIAYNVVNHGPSLTIMSTFMIVVAVFTAALFSISFQSLQVQREIQEGGKLYTIDENIIIDKLKTMIDYGMTMGIITVSFIGITMIFNVNAAPLWVVFLLSTIIGLLIADVFITLLKTVRLIRVVNRIMQPQEKLFFLVCFPSYCLEKDDKRGFLLS